MADTRPDLAAIRERAEAKLYDGDRDRPLPGYDDVMDLCAEVERLRAAREADAADNAAQALMGVVVVEIDDLDAALLVTRRTKQWEVQAAILRAVLAPDGES